MATLTLHEPAVIRAGLDFFPLRPNAPREPGQTRKLVSELLDPWSGPDYIWNRLVLPALRDAVQDVMAAVSAMRQCRLMVSHMLTPAVRLVAERLGLPWVSTVLQPAGLLSEHDLPVIPPFEWLHGLTARSTTLARLVLRLEHWVTRGWGEQVSQVRQDLGLPPSGDNPAFEGQYSPHGVLALFPQLLCPPQPDHPPATRWTGFPLYRGGEPLPEDLQDFLADGQPPLLFTLGSSAVWAAGDFFHSAALASQRLGRRAVLLTGEELVGVPLPASMRALPYASHNLLMPHAAAVIHHGGIGTTAQALHAGKPQLIIPHALDQPDNARRCRDLGVARVLARREVTPHRLARELGRLLEEPAVSRRAAELGTLLRHQDGTTAAADALQERLMEACEPAVLHS